MSTSVNQASRTTLGLGLLIGALLAIVLAAPAQAEEGVAKALSVASSCEVDFNGDKTLDLAMVAETTRGWELIVLIRKGKNYQVFVLSEGKSKIDVSCRTSTTLTEMKNKASAPKLVGSYLLFHKNSKPTMAYYWARGTFQEVWMEE